ncbi:MarR family winged helix-turn-helix transcriptional regulator [Phytohabitans rumicis]|uniref:MarR family winged helix-turn-helix transcriptional regulator n=1 Tax=Phytohabitans rumicis TaxID=1076125 RepID=UPI001FE8EE62|nr:MarR family transcriptional regulator [Phytohabitans rumicis]
MTAEPRTEECLSFLVRHAWLSMRGVVAEALAGHGLSAAQYGSLLLLQQEPGMTVADVGRKVSSTRQSANEMLAGLERAGLLERRAHPRDRRAQQVFLTEAGRARLREAIPDVQAVEGELEAGFTAAERDVVRRWLLRMTTAGAPSEEEIPTS